ncbi:MAG: DUF1343 domain-containing protein [Spirosomataceae bacterium]
MKPPVLFGIDILVQHPAILQGKRVGLVTNRAAFCNTAPYLPSSLALVQAGVNLTVLFSPEHGFGATAADGSFVSHGIEPLTGLPVVSLYGDSFRPKPTDLQHLDLLLYDLPDIGTRFYTYVWTLSYVMEACAEANVPLWIADRPNPVGGNLHQAEGPLLDEIQCSSFIGRWDIPIRHSLTVGELAKLWQAEKNITIDLTVISTQHWHRKDYLAGWHDHFYPPSPAITQPQTALIYLATCFLEGTNVSEGRGTPTPFLVVGAPWLNTEAIVEPLNNVADGALLIEQISFTPTESKYAYQACNGLSFQLLSPHQFKPIETGLHLIALLKKTHPSDFQWKTYPTVANPSGEYHFDLLTGDKEVRLHLESDPDDFIQSIPHYTSTKNWTNRVKSFLLY